MLRDTNTGDIRFKYMSPQKQYKFRSEEAGKFKGLIRLTDRPDQPINLPRQHPVIIAIIGAPYKAEKRGVKGHHTIFLPFTGQREGERWEEGHRHKVVWRPSLKSIYKVEISPWLNPSGPSQPAIIPLFSSWFSQDSLISNLRICLSVSLSAFPSVSLCDRFCSKLFKLGEVTLK